jgi:hypothetical protein
MNKSIPNPYQASSVPAMPVQGAKKFKMAARILWIVAALQIVSGLIFIVLTPDRVDSMLDEALAKNRIPLLYAKAAPAEKRAEFDQSREALILRLRLWEGCDLAAGAIMIGCAIFVRRRPVAATTVALVVFFLLTAAKASFQQLMPMTMVFARVLVLYALVAALVAAVGGKREQTAAIAA